MVIFNSYVSLPEGTTNYNNLQRVGFCWSTWIAPEFVQRRRQVDAASPLTQEKRRALGGRFGDLFQSS